MTQQLMIPAADTRLHAVDAPGGTPALLFLSGGFGTAQNWSRVIRCLDEKYRTVRFDARARGKSGRSADYSVQAAVDDIGRVIDATGIERPILVGWSHGATIAVRYAARHPGRVGGLVPIDGAYPIAMFDEAGKQKVRTQFRRLGWIMRVLAALGRSARMSPAESADIVIEMDAINGELGSDFAALECPTEFVVGTGAHSGATEDEMRTVRAAVAYEKMHELCQRAAEFPPVTDTDRFIVAVLTGAAAELDGDYERANDLLARSIEIATCLDDAHCLIWVSAGAGRAGNWGDGLPYALRAVRLAREHALVSTLPYALEAQASQLIGQGQFDLAFRLGRRRQTPRTRPRAAMDRDLEPDRSRLGRCGPRP